MTPTTHTNPADHSVPPIFEDSDTIFEASEQTPDIVDRIDEQRRRQAPLDAIDEASMESFPCSDPPSYIRCHA